MAEAHFGGASVRADRTWPEPSTAMDLVEFRFFRGTPGCHVRYVEPPVTDEVSGDPVEVQGAAFLQVSCHPVTSLIHGTDNVDRYRSPDTKNVTELAGTGYDGSTLTWTIGLRRRSPFGVAVIMDGGSPSGVSVGIVQ
ncbi:MAG: hypothetical protein R2737_10470 [Candidatus Nanopelagicales bacterium]